MFEWSRETRTGLRVLLLYFSTVGQLEENLMEFLDEVYEHQAREIPGGDWKPDNPGYVDSVRKPLSELLPFCNYGLILRFTFPVVQSVLVHERRGHRRDNIDIIPKVISPPQAPQAIFRDVPSSPTDYSITRVAWLFS